jgi:hypothetical protein
MLATEELSPVGRILMCPLLKNETSWENPGKAHKVKTAKNRL